MYIVRFENEQKYQHTDTSQWKRIPCIFFNFYAKYKIHYKVYSQKE